MLLLSYQEQAQRIRTMARTRAYADEVWKLSEEFQAILAQLERTSDLLERKLLFEDLQMVLQLANRLIKKHDQDLRKLRRNARRR